MPVTLTRYAEAATFLRTALLLGLIKPEAAIAWADDVIAKDSSAPPNVLTLAITKPELSAVREVLRPLAFATESSGIIDSVLGIAARDLAHGRRSVDDTLRVFVQCRRFLKLESTLAEEIGVLELRQMVVASGSAEKLEEIRSRVAALAARFVEIPSVVEIGGG